MDGLFKPRISFWAGDVFGAAAVLLAGSLFGGSASAKQGDEPTGKDNKELATLYKEDQADREPKDGKPIDWTVVGPRDRAREDRVKTLYREDKIKTANDYANAAMVLQHAQAPDDFLLAHELCVVSIAKGRKDSRWLAAASEDRFLMNINRPQRFGTQYRSTSPDAPIKLYEVDPTVTDAHRKEMGAPSLTKAREREAEMDAIFHGKKKP